MELLAPAGGIEQLEAAVRFGADAVYLAADKFGMRARAANFAMEDIPHAVAFAHDHGVNVHVTANILMHQADIKELPEYFEQLQDAGVDACIISDLGAASLLLKHAPKIDLHVSTQASVANAESAKMWHSLGARRIVCAREMSLEQIAEMRRDTPRDLEIEVFVHGAMCMAVSGRCLISSYLTGRSGNKGHCTQPCRWHYTLEEDKRPGMHFPIEEDDNGTYIMNAKDLNMIAHLRELEEAGVDSIKIEGRNKKAFYVASVVNAYRNVLDGGDVATFERELLDISHRPYNTGFYFGEAQQACDYDGYEQETLHVADVLACTEVNQDGTGADEANALTGTGTDTLAGEAGDGVCVPAGMGIDGGDIDLSGAVPDSGVRFAVTAMCRNRFEEGDSLEVLAPHCAPYTITISGLEWLGEQNEAGLRPAPAAVAVANRAEGHYRFTCDAYVEPGSFLRMRIFRRSARSGASESSD